MDIDDMEVEIIRSPRRKKTIQARVEERTLRIFLPQGMSRAEEESWVLKMRSRLKKGRQRRMGVSDDYLLKRFKDFNRKYFAGMLEVGSIRFVTNQNSRHGSCTPSRGTIRISHRLKEVPAWVLDYIVIHEMTHLVYPNHSKAFWDKVNEYKYAERARGFLICKGMEESDDTPL